MSIAVMFGVVVVVKMVVSFTGDGSAAAACDPGSSDGAAAGTGVGAGVVVVEGARLISCETVVDSCLTISFHAETVFDAIDAISGTVCFDRVLTRLPA